MAVFRLIEGTHRIDLDPKGEARVSATVDNLSEEDLRASVLLIPATPPPPAAWIHLEGEKTRSLRSQGQHVLEARLKVPEDAPPGSYSVRWCIRSERDPDRERLDGQPITFVVKAREAPVAVEPRRFPWWIVAAAAGVVAVAVGVYAFWPGAEVPSLVGLSVEEARELLAESELVPVPAGSFAADGVADGRISKQLPEPGDIPDEVAVTREIQYWTQPARTASLGIVVWGVNAGDQIFTRPADGTGAWKNIGGRLKHVSVGREWIWGVNAGDQIFRCKRPCEGEYSLVEGRLKQIDVDDTVVWGVNANDQIYTRPSDGSGAWRNVDGRLKHVSVGREWIWGVNANDQIFRCARPCGGEWVLVEGRLKQIDVGDTEVWGVNAGDQIYTRPADGNGAWRNVGGRLKHVSVGREWVWGVNANDQIFRCARPCGGEWVLVEGRLKQIDVAGFD